MSIGADAGNVVVMVLRDSMGPVLLGGAIGLGLATALVHLIRSFLFGVQPADPVTLVKE